tara:strand:+ start:864 stop:1244 length:381 start_codon:yes stop_codon:yes gene_type:complete
MTVEIVLVDAVHCLINSDWTLNKELANYLKSLNLKVYIITNASAEKISAIIDDFEIFTLENNPAKTDSLYFEKFISEKNEGLADNLFYFDHSQANLDSAKSAGLSKLFLWTGDLEELKSWFVKTLK